MSGADPRDVRRGSGGGDAPPGDAPRPAVEVRRARPADLPSVLRIERASFPVPWSEAAFRAVMRRDHGVLLVADEGGEVAGYAAAWFAADEAELGDIAVAPGRRRRGVARTLMEAVEEEARRRGARRLFLQVRTSNVAARRLYVSVGFREVGRRRRYYRSPPEDALVFRRELGPGEREARR